MIYLIERIGETNYDEYRAFVVRARTATRARKFVAAGDGQAEPRTWTDPSLSTCTRIREDGDEAVILSDTLDG